MFWVGMIIFAILAVSPIFAAVLLNKKDGAHLSQPSPGVSMNDSEH